MAHASIVVPVKDRRERMLRCLEALLAQDHGDFEIIVCDNGSSDGSYEACVARAASAGVPVRVERVAGTLGRVRNVGSHLAGGRHVAFTDSDCVPDRGWLSAACAVLDAEDAVGVVCGQTRPTEAARGDWAHTVDVRALTGRFETCNVVYRRAALLATPGFDETVGDGWEDTAAGWAVLGAGWRAAYAPAAVVLHDVTYPGLWSILRREQRQRNVARIVKRYPAARQTLFLGVFLNLRSALFLSGAAGLAMGTRRPRARWLAVGYLPFLLRRKRPGRMAQLAAYDVALHVAMLRGALRDRYLVL